MIRVGYAEGGQYDADYGSDDAYTSLVPAVAAPTDAWSQQQDEYGQTYWYNATTGVHQNWYCADSLRQSSFSIDASPSPCRY